MARKPKVSFWSKLWSGVVFIFTFKWLQREPRIERSRVPRRVYSLIRAGGIKLDVGCGDNKQDGFVGMDNRPTRNVDILHDCEDVPYPLPDACCNIVLASHLVEHLKPWLVVDILNEWWRLLKVGGQLWLSMPYAGSFGFWQDPTHVKSWNEATAEYFDPSKFLYNIYKPKPWKIERNSWYEHGNIEIILVKLPLDHGIQTPGGYDNIPDDKKQGKKKKAVTK